MIRKRLFIIIWVLVGIAISLFPYFIFVERLPVFISVSVFFVFSIAIQYIIQRNFFEETHGINEEKNLFLKKLTKELLFSCLIGIVQVLSLLGLGYLILPVSSFEFEMFKWNTLAVGSLQPFILNFLYRLFFLIQQYTFLKKEVHSFKKLSKVTQKKTLQDLVSPHFLFNSLNTAASITSENADEAVEFVKKLSDLYEFILKNNENQLIELREELEIVEKYGFLIQTRFGDFFCINIKIPKMYLNALIPPLTLQNLVENAVKHNSVTRKKPLTLTIEIEEGYIIVENNINPKKTYRNESTKLGLSYIKSQFQQFSPNEIRVVQNHNRFRVEIPVIHQTLT